MTATPQGRYPQVAWVVRFVDGDDVAATNPIVGSRARGTQLETKDMLSATGDATAGCRDVKYRRQRRGKSGNRGRAEVDDLLG